MTSKELIEKLQELDPAGGREVIFVQGDVEGYAWSPDEKTKFVAGDDHVYVEEY
jgi:hypothetical protein